jgi:phosphoribosylanthranilate isomerase
MGEHGLAPLLRGSFVKIDGLREPEHAVAAIGAGADAIGFIFAPARRQVTSETAAACLAAARAAHRERAFLAVGVFVDAPASEIARVASESELDLVQLHGDESPDLLADLPVPTIKVFRPLPGTASHAVLSEIDRFQRAPRPPAVFLIDGYAPGSSGGSGARADWGLAAAIASERPVILGGGLDPENVGEAIRRVRPLGVDVSSGVEVDGVKDTARIESFIRAARSAFRDEELAQG